MSDELEVKKWVGGICVKDDSILLIHRINKKSLFHKEFFVFPGKEVEADENLEEALREAFEDFSMTVKLKELFYSKEEDMEDQEFYYTCTHVLGEPQVAKDSDEATKMLEGEQVYTPMWIPLSDLDDLIVYPESVKVKIIESLEA